MLSVKTIFKTLIGTIVLIVVSALFIEIYNISTSGLQLNQIMRMACRQGCVLFSQETYKKRTDNTSGELGGSVNMADVLDNRGRTYISGKFYPADSPKAIYDTLYNSSEFSNWCSTIAKNNWKNVDLIQQALTRKSELQSRTLNTNPGADNTAYNEAQLALMYNEVMTTPLNLGIPYMDKATLQKMFRWNLAQLLSNCNPELIRDDDYGNTYVSFKGFKIYADRATIDDITYEVFDLTNRGDSEWNRFIKLTNIDPEKLSFGDTANMEVFNGDERQKICIAAVKFTVPVAYEGITPLKNVVSAAFDSEVRGLDTTAPDVQGSFNDAAPAELRLGGFADRQYNGSDYNSTMLPVPVDLIYYIVR